MAAKNGLIYVVGENIQVHDGCAAKKQKGLERSKAVRFFQQYNVFHVNGDMDNLEEFTGSGAIKYITKEKKILNDAYIIGGNTHDCINESVV